jgi:hypothetical protein
MGNATDGFVAKKWDMLLRGAGYLFNRVEQTNRSVAYLGALGRFYKAGPKAMMRRIADGRIDDRAKQFADDVVNKTQFRYGKVGIPQAFRGPAGSVLGQFSTFGLNQIEFMIEQFRTNPLSMLGLFALQHELAVHATEKLLDIDMSDVVGFAGFTFFDLFKMARSMSEGDREEFREAGLKMANRGWGIVSVPLLGGRFGPGHELLKGVGEGVALTGELARTGKTLETELPRIQRLVRTTIGPVSGLRAWDAAVNEIGRGGTFTGALRLGLGFPSRSTATRIAVLRDIERGNRRRAFETLGLFEERTGEELPIEGDAFGEAFQRRAERRTLLRQRERFEGESLAPHVRRRLP